MPPLDRTPVIRFLPVNRSTPAASAAPAARGHDAATAASTAAGTAAAAAPPLWVAFHPTRDRALVTAGALAARRGAPSVWLTESALAAALAASQLLRRASCHPPRATARDVARYCGYLLAHHRGPAAAAAAAARGEADGQTSAERSVGVEGAGVATNGADDDDDDDAGVYNDCDTDAGEETGAEGGDGGGLGSATAMVAAARRRNRVAAAAAASVIASIVTPRLRDPRCHVSYAAQKVPVPSTALVAMAVREAEVDPALAAAVRAAWSWLVPTAAGGLASGTTAANRPPPPAATISGGIGFVLPQPVGASDDASPTDGMVPRATFCRFVRALLRCLCGDALAPVDLREQRWVAAGLGALPAAGSSWAPAQDSSQSPGFTPRRPAVPEEGNNDGDDDGAAPPATGEFRAPTADPEVEGLRFHPAPPTPQPPPHSSHPEANDGATPSNATRQQAQPSLAAQPRGDRWSLIDYDAVFGATDIVASVAEVEWRSLRAHTTAGGSTGGVNFADFARWMARLCVEWCSCGWTVAHPLGPALHEFCASVIVPSAAYVGTSTGAHDGSVIGGARSLVEMRDSVDRKQPPTQQQHEGRQLQQSLHAAAHGALVSSAGARSVAVAFGFPMRPGFDGRRAVNQRKSQEQRNQGSAQRSRGPAALVASLVAASDGQQPQLLYGASTPGSVVASTGLPLASPRNISDGAAAALVPLPNAVLTTSTLRHGAAESTGGPSTKERRDPTWRQSQFRYVAGNASGPALSQALAKASARDGAPPTREGIGMLRAEGSHRPGGPAALSFPSSALTADQRSAIARRMRLADVYPVRLAR